MEVVSDLIDRHVPLGPGAVALDIGCGDTFVVERLAAEKPQASFYAVDTALTDDLLAQYRGRLQTRNVFVSSSLDTLQPPVRRDVSLVLLMDVIEHIGDDRGFLTSLLARPFIGPGSHVLVTVPSYQSLFCSHDEFLGHYRRYSNRQLRLLLERSGLTVLDIGYFFASLLPMRVAQVIKERLLGVQAENRTTGLVTWKGGAGVTSFLRRLLIADATLTASLRRIGVTMPGLSNYAVCRKSA